MRRVILLPGFLALFLASAAGGATPSHGATGGRNASWDDYRIILTRNVFARDRSAPSVERSAPARPVPVISSVSSGFVLTGVAVRGDVRVAFFEDSQSGETMQATVGGTVGDGGVVSISLDSVELRFGEAIRKIRVGENLGGVTVTLSPAAASVQPAAASATTAAGPAGSAGDTTDKSTNDILERMRQRRLKEMKQ